MRREITCGVNRRVLLGGLAALSFGTSAARARSDAPTVGFLTTNEKSDSLNVVYRQGLVEGLAEAGFTIPDRLRWLERYTGRTETYDEARAALAALTRELVAEGADVIIASGPATLPAIANAGPVPVVFGFSADPIEAGLASSLAHPLHNASGVTLLFVETNAKRVQMLKELAPSIRRIALIASPLHPGQPRELEVCRQTAAPLGVDLAFMPVLSEDEVEKALAQAAAMEADALMSLIDPVTNNKRERLAQWAIERRLPSASGWAVHADAGALMTYGPSVTWCFHRVGYYAARVLAGAKAADLPIEQPTRFELVVNLRTADAIGLKAPQSVLARADRIIE